MCKKSFIFLSFQLAVFVQPAWVPEAGAPLLSTSQSPWPASQPEGKTPPPVLTEDNEQSKTKS